SEIRNVALSLVAIAVAIVIATKELILCFSGAIFRAGTNAYGVGDCVEISGLRGDVIDQNLFGTTILELGPTQGSRQYTGRAVILPNSLLLSHPLVTETYMGDYVVHFITIPMSVHDDWQKAEEILMKVAEAECEPFIEEARKHMASLEKKHWIDPPSVNPRVSIFCHDAQTLRLVLRIPTPARRKGRLEQSIIRRFLREFVYVRPAGEPPLQPVTAVHPTAEPR
ncbi:MAG TPA: mechanosensitive ion channel protein MscS, partial [Verrucomicrobiales bacterium]|nr:mechanosensitive ion channel protein MscS [Verrucomicrobiales bacterium]